MGGLKARIRKLVNKLRRLEAWIDRAQIDKHTASFLATYLDRAEALDLIELSRRATRLEDLTTAQLYDLARELGISKYSRVGRQTLVLRIQDQTTPHQVAKILGYDIWSDT